MCVDQLNKLGNCPCCISQTPEALCCDLKKLNCRSYVPVTIPFINTYLTATITEFSDGTSEFLAVFKAPFQTIVVPLIFL